MSTPTLAAPDKAKKDPEDRRRSERKPHVVEGFIFSPTAVDPLDRDELTSLNVSRHGLGFEYTHEIPLGTFHIVDVAMGEQRLRVEVRIMSCRQLENKRHEIGAEFC